MSPSVAERFHAKYVVEPSGCWVWKGSTNGAGYGEIRIDGKKVYAHRWVVESTRGPIPEGLQIDHLCRNRSCVNPEHLEPVTPKENVQRGDAAKPKPGMRQEFCSNGHPYDSNTYVRPDGKGRNCVECARDRSREYQRRKRAKGV